MFPGVAQCFLKNFAKTLPVLRIDDRTPGDIEEALADFLVVNGKKAETGHDDPGAPQIEEGGVPVRLDPGPGP